MAGYLIPTPWETRNLGLESFSVGDGFLNDPDESGLKEEIKALEDSSGGIFIYARIPKKFYYVNRILERTGFYFIEQTLEPYTAFEKNEVFKTFLRDKDAFVPKRYRPSDLSLLLLDKDDQRLCRKIEDIAAESFSDDRCHLDPNCSKEIADRRFVYWVRDLLADPKARFYLLLHDGDAAGFMALKGTNLILNALSNNYFKSGLGGYLWLSVMKDMYRQSINHAHTLISANNTTALNMYSRLGFKFRNPSVTFHYWSKGAAGEAE